MSLLEKVANMRYKKKPSSKPKITPNTPVLAKPAVSGATVRKMNPKILAGVAGATLAGAGLAAYARSKKKSEEN